MSHQITIIIFIFLFLLLLNPQSQNTVFCNVMCRLAGGLTCRLTSVIRSPPVSRSRWPYYRSAGHRLVSLRMALPRGRGWSNGLECDSKFVRCLILLSWMTSCTAGIPRTLWIIWLVTYRGTSTIALNIFLALRPRKQLREAGNRKFYLLILQN